jgi:hypothetical protein
MKTLAQNLKTCLTIGLGLLLLGGCSSDDPQKEDTPELVTKAILTFTPTGGGTIVVATATDPDGEGVQDLSIDGPIDLEVDKQYVMNIELINELAGVGQPGYSITEEVEAEGAEHMFFFAWSGAVFHAPAGDGNIDNRTDPVDYVDLDSGGLPIGLITNWTSSAVMATGTFRVVLKHQPGTKTATSGSTVGETDLDLTFSINVQ